MEAQQQIHKLTEFLEKHYYAEILEKVRKGERFLTTDFKQLAAFDPESAHCLLDQPEEFMKAGEISIAQTDENAKNFALRVKNLPESCRIMIRNIRSTHLKKLVFVEGVVRNKSEVRPQVTSARFECPSCGNTLTVIQLELKFHEPSRCSCGRKGKFHLLGKELMDAQSMVLEEVSEQLEGGEQPKRINVFLKNDLVSPLTEKRTNPGSRLIVVGTLSEVPVMLRTGGQSTRFDILLEANSIDFVEEDFTDITINPEEREQIIALSKDIQLMRKMRDSIAPSIYGHEKIKEALVLQLLGGVRKKREDGIITRGDMHVLLVGDPGSAKSQMLKRISLVAPKGRYITGKGASGAGLSATVVKDEFLGGWSLEAGALVLANRGICTIDELDKMSQEDSWAMHEALEQQQITISKANIQATLRCETTVLAAANPKLGRFEIYEPLGQQIGLPPTLINRFDLIFPIKDVPEASKDEKMAQFILAMHKENTTEPPIETRLIRKYMAYARQNIFPKLTDEAVAELKEYFLKMRSMAAGAGSPIPITARQLEGLVRLSEAHAKLRLSSFVTREDAKKAVELLDYCLRQIAYDERTGTIDIDRISAEIPASQRNKILAVKELLRDLEDKFGKSIQLSDLVNAADEKNIGRSELDDIMQKLKRDGDIYEPKAGFVSRIT